MKCRAVPDGLPGREGGCPDRSPPPPFLCLSLCARKKMERGRSRERSGTMDELTRGNRSTLRWPARRRHLAVPPRWPGDPEEATGDDVSDVVRDREKWQ
ncbi:hypothetical protein GUJ93_ZPchr0006g41103 [Zizania palustris]|uniref:Uncharacterized protein n=1 Tax=Zizania palustris TaxID=103762 RepID=A0A8J5T7T5_ZIZPA|nr:hypothetical protein GUJ93_ZPchr0006g41103 [Zizania palustris]